MVNVYLISFFILRYPCGWYQVIYYFFLWLWIPTYSQLSIREWMPMCCTCLLKILVLELKVSRICVIIFLKFHILRIIFIWAFCCANNKNWRTTSSNLDWHHLMWQSTWGKWWLTHWASLLRWIWSISEYNLTTRDQAKCEVTATLSIRLAISVLTRISIF